MAGMETTALRDRLIDGLDRFASAMRCEVRRSNASRGLNPAQGAVLRMLLARPAGLRVRVLAAHLGVRQPTVTGSVIALERKGLVRRQTDPTDARATIVKATPEALANPREFDIHRWKQSRMAGQRIGETFARENGRRWPQPADIRVGGQ